VVDALVVYGGLIALLAFGVSVGWLAHSFLGKPVEKIVYSAVPNVRRGAKGRFEKIADEPVDPCI